MGSNGARSGGGGSGVPDQIRPPKIRRKEVLQENIKKLVSMSPTIRILEGIGKGIENIKKEKAADVNLGTSDYQGSPTGKKSRVNMSMSNRNGGNGGNGGNQVVQSTTTPSATMTIAQAPTNVEVSQSSATEAVDSDDPLYIKRKTKREGRSLTILTSSKGVDDDFTLGKKSLLGRA
jgi:hypothetical protein